MKKLQKNCGKMLTSRAVCGILIERLRNAAEKQQKLTAAHRKKMKKWLTGCERCGKIIESLLRDQHESLLKRIESLKKVLDKLMRK